MERNFQAEYRSSVGDDEEATRVLYVDGDEEALAAVTSGADDAPVDLWATSDSERARAVVDSDAWDCVVVGGDLARSDRRDLVSAAACPTVLFVPAGSETVPETVLDEADAVLERGTEDGAVRDLCSTVIDLASGAGPPADTPAGQQEAQLVDSTRADELVRDVVRDLSAAATREEVERSVCQRLVDLDGVTMAWIGKREGGNDRIVPATIVGEPKQYLRDVVASTSTEDAKGGPVLTAIETGEPVVVNDFRDDDMVDFWRDLALSYDIYALLMVPIIHGDTVHGVLCAYGTQPGTFDEAMVERLALLGDAVGFAVTAVQNRRLLQRDVSVELEFRSHSGDAYLVRAARACDCRIETAGSVDVGAGVLEYVRVVDGSPDCVAESALASDRVDGSRVVRTTEDGGVVELRASTCLRTELSAVGARLERAVVRPTGTRIVAEVPRDGDVRTVHEVVCRSNPDAELVTKTERERSPDEGTAGDSVADALTERQREVLQAAYLAGYYAWPRDTTAEELAETLGIASPTLHQHLRRAESNLLDALFDE